MALTDCKQRVNAALDALLVANPSSTLLKAMRYAVLNGGKRLRPLLVYYTGHALGVKLAELDTPACAVELIHAYSLVHDDLPAMDDDDWRRGQPTCHKAFDEATAILVGDALQTLAFQCLADNTLLSPAQSLRMIRTLAQATGAKGMAGGQALDLANAETTLDLAQLETTHRLKTGALISASVELGLIAADKDQDSQIAQPFRDYAHCLGLAFQIQDDILDIEGDITTLGKQPGNDRRQNKTTYPALIGLEAAKTKVATLQQQALFALESLGDTAESLRHMMTTMVKQP